MFNWFSLIYTLPMVGALIVAGAIVGPRVNASARKLLWSGIGLLLVAQVATLVTPYLAMQRSLLSVFQLVSAVLMGVHITGTVLLIVAVGRAARGSKPVHGGPGGYRYPADPGRAGDHGNASQSGYSPQSLPGQPGYPPQPTGRAGYPAQSQAGQPGYPPAAQPGYPTSGQPGQWGNDQRR